LVIVMDPQMSRTEIDGESAKAEDLLIPAVVNYGHFTGMRVRGGAVRGLDLHLARLESANRELYGVSLNQDRVRAYIRHALGGQTNDTNVRVTVFSRDLDFPAGADLRSCLYRNPRRTRGARSSWLKNKLSRSSRSLSDLMSPMSERPAW
jgi:branched-subunit amino acid aminotransferase/4-amino-4-deoxychorismate lyase